jgi:predicted transcriptional regulator
VAPSVVELVAAHPIASAAVAATASVGAGAWLLSRREAWRYALLAPFAALYSRISKSDVLDHDTRDQIFGLIRARPGITYTELLRETALNRGALLHHVHQLERHEIVQSRREGTNRRFYPTGERLPIVVPLTAAQQRVLSLLAERGPLTQGEVAAALGVSQQGASFHLKTLQRLGHVEAQAMERNGAHRWALVEGPPSALRP